MIQLVGRLLGNITVGVIISLFAVLIFITAINYIDFEPVGFLIGKSETIRNSIIFRVSFITHIFSASVALFLSAIQIQPWIRTKFIKFHNKTGNLYTFLVLFLAAPSGLVLAWYSEPRVCFSILAISWWVFTYLGYKAIKSNKITIHKHWMFRGFSLIVSAILLRLYLGIYTAANEEPLSEFGYQLISWLSWVPNLILVEILIRTRKVSFE